MVKKKNNPLAYEVLKGSDIELSVDVKETNIVPDNQEIHVDVLQFDNIDSFQIELKSYMDGKVRRYGDYPKIENLLTIHGSGCFARGNLQAIKAKAKNGKTTALNLVVAGLLANEATEGLNIFGKKANAKTVLHIDTEQHVSNVHHKMNIVHKMLGVKRELENYHVFSFREYSYIERFQFTKDAIDDLKPDLVIIDGIVDLIADFNDPTESKNFISELMKMSSEFNCAIICVLHENKSARDSTMRGHLGTELLNKCSEVYSVNKSNDIFTVSQTDTRNAPVPEWCFTIGEGGVPTVMEEMHTITKISIRYMEKVTTVNEFFMHSENNPISYTDLINELMPRLGLKDSGVRKTIAELLRKGVLAKDENNLYRLKESEDSMFKK